ncbi:hypothetical protein MPSEU_000400900 [Mayamaea pseudoterrestris]|nr:hypothetical protein MPSEU_000400900 [Mayamaea pseudoterrestris]
MEAMSGVYMQRLAQEYCVSVKDIVIVSDNAPSPLESETRKKQLRSPLRKPKRWNSSDGLTKMVHGGRRRTIKREKTYPACRWEPACKESEPPSSPPMSLRGFSTTKSIVDFAMKLPSRCPDLPATEDRSTARMINDVLAELHVLEDLSV